MVRIKALRVLVMVALVALATTSCTLKQTWDLMGKWQKVDGAETMEFTGNGLVKWSDGSSIATVPYKVEGKKLEINLGSLGVMTAELSTQNNLLTVKNAAGKASTFKRAL